MLKTVVIFVFVFVGCYADAPAQTVYCNEMPDIYSCLDYSNKVINPDVSRRCSNIKLECEQWKCLFRESGWLDGDNVNKRKVSDHFDQFARDHPAWSPAVTHLKAACLGDLQLPAQGPLLNCPFFDILHCSLTSFIRNATPSQWKTTPACEYPRSYAYACPVCPSACFASQVPYGSCNACMSLPRSN